MVTVLTAMHGDVTDLAAELVPSTFTRRAVPAVTPTTLGGLNFRNEHASGTSLSQKMSAYGRRANILHDDVTPFTAKLATSAWQARLPEVADTGRGPATR